VDTCIAVHDSGAFENDVINIGSDFEISVLELAKTVIRVTQSRSSVAFLPPLPEGDMRRRCPDTRRMRQLLDRPLVSLEDGIGRLADHYRSAGAA
jgi:nucleoside-diphosphate-sugar epimerase